MISDQVNLQGVLAGKSSNTAGPAHAAMSIIQYVQLYNNCELSMIHFIIYFQKHIACTPVINHLLC